MDIKQLVYFVKLCEDKNFSIAASNLFMSQQGLSMAIIRLERELNTKLFYRAHGGVALTESGEFLKSRAQSIISQFEECNDYFSTTTTSNRNTVAAACVFDLIGSCPQFFQKFLQNSNPAFHLKIIEETAIQCESLVTNGEVELALVTGPIDSFKFESDFLFQKRICAIVNRLHPLAQFDSIDIVQLKNVKILMMNRKFKVYHNFMRRCNDAGFHADIIFEGDRMTLYHNMVKENPSFVGISVEFFADNFPNPQLKTLFFNDPTFVWSIHLISKTGKPLSRAAKEFRRTALQYFGGTKQRLDK